jgi:hypothetical protein
LLRQLQPDGDFAGWCIGHASCPVWTHVHVTASAAAVRPVHSDTGAAVSNAS